jgi:phosphatidylinositol alpha 1,6-mannosyltransferase
VSSVGCYVALGDSFTCGREEERAFRWPDEVARQVNADRYANLATVGATSCDVEEEQLERALELDPDLVSLICGANDVLFSVRPDPDGYASRLARMYRRLREAVPRAVILTATYPDLSRFLDLRQRTRARVRGSMRAFNDAVRGVARAYGAVCLDWAGHPDGPQPAHLADDGFHPSEEGHREAAAQVVRALTPARPRATA